MSCFMKDFLSTDLYILNIWPDYGFDYIAYFLTGWASVLQILDYIFRLTKTNKQTKNASKSKIRGLSLTKTE